MGGTPVKVEEIPHLSLNCAQEAAPRWDFIHLAKQNY